MTTYLDNASTTAVCSEAVEAMLPYFSEHYGNASSLHAWGRAARRALEESRETVARHINAPTDRLFFTSSGTESDNLAILGIAHRHRTGHVITSAIEHPAVLETCHSLEKRGFAVTYLPVDRYGAVDPETLAVAIRNDTVLVSVMHANNEIGTVQPIAELAAVARERNVPFHTDAVQTAGKLPLDVETLHADMLSISSHKLHGPKGVGALYVRRGVRLEPLTHGGGHERGLRPSTENVPGIVGFATAFSLACRDMDRHVARMTRLRDRIVTGVGKIEESHLTGHPTNRLPNHASFYFRGVEGESLILLLDDHGIATSTGSACSSKKLQASHVLQAIGVPAEDAHGSLRVSLSRYTTEEDISHLLATLPEVVAHLRSISPLWNKN
jgi:cysteine desulfurase